MRVSEVMTRHVELISPDQSIQKAAQCMSDMDVGALPVAEKDRLVGMVTDRDIAVRAVALGKGVNTPVREVMTPRKDVDWIDAGLDARGVRDKLLETPHSRLPVARGSVDDIVGVVQARDIAAALFQGETLDLEQLMRPTKVIHDQIDAMDALEALRVAEVPMLLVHDEYGHFDGLVTPADLLSAIAGEFASDQDIGSEPFVVERDDGSLLIAGSMPADQMAERLGIELGEDRDYATAAGHVLAILKHLPTEGEKFTDRGWRFEIIDMDGRKIDKLLVTEIRKPKDAEAE